MQGYGAQTHKEFLFGKSGKMAIQVILVTLHLPFMFVMFWKE
jgi:hypothetical protein